MPPRATESAAITVRASAPRPLPALLLPVLLFASLPAALSANDYPPPPGTYRSLDQPAPLFSSATRRPQNAMPDTAMQDQAAAAQRQPFAASKLFGAPLPAPRPRTSAPATAGTPRQGDFSMDFRRPARPPAGPGDRHPPGPASRAAWPPRDGGRPRYPTPPAQERVQAPAAAAMLRPHSRADGGTPRFSADMPGSPTARRSEVQSPASTAPAQRRQPEPLFRPPG